MSDIPIELPSKNQYPFATSRLDCIGPFLIVLQGKQYPAYIILFTCLVIRAVHLKISSSLSNDNNLFCIRRFIARRGKPLRTVSDSGTKIVGYNIELKKCLENLQNKKEFLESMNLLDVTIEEKFNSPAAPFRWFLVKISADFQTSIAQNYRLQNTHLLNTHISHHRY